jgi:hypothetical protein
MYRKSFNATIVLPSEFTERTLVTAINIAIQEEARSKGIDLGRSIDWDVIVREDHRWKDPNGHS